MMAPKTVGRGIGQRHPISDVQATARRAIRQCDEPPSRPGRFKLAITRATSFRAIFELVPRHTSGKLLSHVAPRERHYLTVFRTQYRLLFLARSIRRIHARPLIRRVVIKQQIYPARFRTIPTDHKIVSEFSFFRKETKSSEKGPILQEIKIQTNHKSQ